MTHIITFRVYYEDTDAGGVVYYANYLKFAERARTEMLRACGIDQSALMAEEGLAFVVRRAALELKRPARLDDEITIETKVTSSYGATLTMLQYLHKGDEVLAELEVTVAAVSMPKFKPVRVPPRVLKALSA